MRGRSTLFVICVTIAAISSRAQDIPGINFRWYNDDNYPLTNRLGEEIGKHQATVLTFLSSDTTVNAWSAVAGSKITLENAYADDFFFMSRGNSIDPGYYDTQFMQEKPTTNIGKYVYAIILDYPYASFLALGSTDAERLANVPRNGSVYAGITEMGNEGGPPIALANAEPPWGVPQSFRGGPVQTSLQVIPEPSSLVLIFGAAGASGLWRRLRRR